MNKFLDFALTRSTFPLVTDAHLEQKKIGILRIFLGIIVFTRFAEIGYSLNSLPHTTTTTFASLYILTLIALFTIGFFTPVVTLLLFASVRAFDQFAGTTTLGTIILVNTLLVLILVNHGRSYSIDHLFLRADSFIGKVIKRCYSIIGTPSATDISKAYLLGFIIYALISLGALIFHLDDDYWLRGVTVKSLLTNSYLGKQYIFFRWLETTSPITLGLISVGAGIFQTVFQGLMIPLIFFKIGKRFVIMWGFNFILTSLFLINLSYLPHVELILWSLIFFPIPVNTQRLEILYQHQHSGIIALLRVINFNGRYIFLLKSESRAQIHSQESNSTSLTGIYNKKNLTGNDLYLTIIQMNPFLWIFGPFFLMLRILKVDLLKSPFSFGSFRLETVRSTTTIPPYQKQRVDHFYNVYGALLLVFIFLGFPVLRDKVIPIFFRDSSIPNSIKSGIEKIGLHIPGVFNRTDLCMGNNWMVVYRYNKNNWELVPVTDTDGARLSYAAFDIFGFTNHNSDVLYFGGTLGYRREIIDNTDLIKFHEANDHWGYRHIKMMLSYDYNYNDFKEPVRYKIYVYGSHSSETDRFKSDPARHNPRLLYSKYYLFNGKELTAISSNDI